MTAPLDSISIEILWSRLISLVDEAAATFQRASFSTLVREANDFAVVLTDVEGFAIAQSTKSIASFTATIPATIREILRGHPPETLKEGDIIATNDPWLGTGHIHDITIVCPIFQRGVLIGFSGIASHLPDIGGRLRSAGIREIYEEGLQIPIVKLVEQGRKNEALVSLIARNVRVPEYTLGDIFGAISGCTRLSERLTDMLDAEDLDLAMLGRELQLRSENAMRNAIAAVPDGAYRSVVEHDGFEERVMIDCTIHVHGDSVIVDYEGTSPQIPRAVNVVPSYRFAYTVYGLKCALAPNIPNNDGALRPITTKAPEGTILNPRYPAASGARNMIGHMLPTVVMQALVPILGARAQAEGASNSSFTMSGEHNGRRYAVVNFLNGGQGGTASRRGHDALSFPSNLGNTPIEVMEQLAPIRILQRRIRTGSGGDGRWPGGNGLDVAFQFLGDTPATCSFIVTRRIAVPKGLEGGADGLPAHVRINGKEIDPTEHRLLERNDVVEFCTAGGGGFGDHSGTGAP